ncbi:ABC transporter permease [Paracraurococcus ruber]|uniref:ABC transporter permease n=1 Tax=Paracraurococcus ruber TaxID=77675 RepID=A0ABS1CQM8_9PROT|nr:ABC transporter permease subunit [Paracraurococcus ruber]MBK1656653.1 ABC transporter permease [Paracraurococcus ruber]TDG33725.1 ABC transporter permease subunit [Paracraurococcus ruber]
MSATTLGARLAAPARPAPLWPSGWAAGLAWLGAAAVILLLPDADDLGRTAELGFLAATLGGLLLLAAIAAAVPALGARLAPLRAAGPWLLVLALALLAWELATAKLDWLPRPFFAAPQSILEVFTDDYARLGESVGRSLLLVLPGYLLGAAIGFLFGVAMGWSRLVGYWAHPVVRLIGPLPATAWLPIAFFAFASSRGASTFLVALASFFPVTVLTWSGVSAVSKSYYDVARTMGASPWFLVRKVAVPAAMPSVFVGLFMGLGASFSVLVVAEMMGVKAGLGWYMQWAQGWAAYANMYAALLVMAVMCSSAVTLLFRVRDRLLSWQKGLVRW